MNERMLQLYKMSHVSDTATDPSNNMPYETTCFSAETFAKLIVQECLSIMNNSDGDLDFAIWKTKKDFGIE